MDNTSPKSRRYPATAVLVVILLAVVIAVGYYFSRPPAMFSDTFDDGDAAGWSLDPASGYWQVDAGELVASGETKGGWNPERASIPLSRGMRFWEARMVADTKAFGNNGIAVLSGDKAHGVHLAVNQDGDLQWGAIAGNEWKGWNVVTRIDPALPHVYKIELQDDGLFVVFLDGMVQAYNIWAGNKEIWKNGIATGILSTQTDKSGQVLKTRFDNVAASSNR